MNTTIIIGKALASGATWRRNNTNFLLDALLYQVQRLLFAVESLSTVSYSYDGLCFGIGGKVGNEPDP